ncbi:uncharacterized protein LOC144912843 [Branchiostoma floridae x Branchiostoma belcheri]
MAAGGLLATVPTPGFFHLDLFIKDTKDVTPWYDELKRRLEREKGPMESAMTNLLSVFAFHKVRGKGEARKLLEKLTEKDENNLNAIANKQFIYSQLMRAKDEMACRDRLQELLSDQSDAARARNARCFAEQAYALTFDVRDDSKDMVSKVRHAISLLETALSLVCDTDTLVNECLVWKYYLSFCYWRFDQVKYAQGQDKTQLTEDDKKEVLLKAQSLLIEVTQMNPSRKHSESYVAKAWALLGALVQEVEVKDELDDALDNFAQALQLQNGFAYSRIHAARGRSLEASGELEKAAESYKRAVENEETTFNWNLTGVLRNLLKLHGSDSDPAFWINEGYKKYPDITKIIQGCVFKFGSQMIQVCQYLIDHDKPMLARLCLKCFQRHNNWRHRTAAASMERKLPGVDGDRGSGADDMTSTQSKPEILVNIPVSVEKPRHGHEFQYDFFVSHSSKDADWVNFALLPAMEVDLRFKGCVADRDFMPGKSVFDNIIYSIENSYKTLLILTPNFVTSEWCKYETEQALVESLTSKTGRVIPIMLHNCDVPASLRTITYLDVSRDAIGSYDWLKLKKALEETPPTDK